MQSAQKSSEDSRSDVEVDVTETVRRGKRGVMGTGGRECGEIRKEEKQRLGWKIINKVIYNEFGLFWPAAVNKLRRSPLTIVALG